MSNQVHIQLKIKRGSIHICSAHASNASCRNFNCGSLHACRAWLAGNCRTPGCRLVHSLRTIQNTQALKAVGVNELPQCDENLRYEVAIIFPQLCVYYVLGKCNQPTCFKLHVCKELLLNGSCSRQGCQLNHSFGPRERNILFKLGVTIPPENAIGNTSPRTLQTTLTDILCADGSHVKTCACQVPKHRTRNRHRAPGAAGAASVANSSESDNNDDTRSVDSQVSSCPSNDCKLPVGASGYGGDPTSTAVTSLANDAKSQYGANRYGGYPSSITGAPNVANSANASPASTGQRHGAAANERTRNDERNAPSMTNIAPSAAVSDAYGAIKNVSSIIKYLLFRGGWAPWAEFTDHFKISQNFFAMMNWLVSKQKQDFSFIGQKANWIRQVNYNGQIFVPDEVFILISVIITIINFYYILSIAMLLTSFDL